MGIPAASLPALYATGMSSGYLIGYTVVLHLGGGDALYMVTKRDLTIAPFSLTVKYKGNTITPLADYYRAQYLAARVDGAPVNGIGDVDLALNISDGGGLAARAEARITLLNMPLDGERLDVLLSMFDIENYDLEIWESYIPYSGVFEIDIDSILRFRGVVRDGAAWDHRTLTIRAFDRRDVETAMLPKYLINDVDFPKPDEHFLGKPFPFIFGDYHTENVGTLSFGASGTIYAYEMMQCHAAPTVRPSSGISFYPADHEIAALSRSTNPVFFRTPDAKYWIVKMLPTFGASNYVNYVTDANGRQYAFIRSPIGDAYITPNILGANNTDGAFGETHLDVLLNDDITDYVTVAYPNVLSLAFDAANIPADFVIAEDVAGGFGAAVDLNLFVMTSSRTGNVNLKIYDREAGTTVDKGVINADRFSIGYDMPSGAATWYKLQQYDMEIRPQSGGSIRIHRAFVQARCRPKMSTYSFSSKPSRAFGHVRKFFAPDLPERVSHNDSTFISTKGALFGSWITDGGRSVGYSPAGLITNAAYGIEWILRTQLNAAGRIDTASVDVVGNTTNGTRKDWLFRGIQRDQRDGFEIIRQIGAEHGVKLLYDHDSAAATDVHRLITLPDNASTVYMTITDDEIMRDDNGIPHVEITKTPQSDIVNAYAVKFKYNFTVDEYSVERYIDDRNNDGDVESNFADDTGSPRLNSYVAWCEQSIATYKRRILKTVELDFISDPATAELRIKRWLDWNAFQRHIVKMKLLKTADTVGLRMGDVCKINSGLLNDLHRNVTRFVVDAIAYPPIGATVEPYIVVTFHEVPGVYTGLRVIRSLSMRGQQGAITI